MTDAPECFQPDCAPSLLPEMVLQEARELHRHWMQENKPYSAGVVADCIATIENLLTRAAPAEVRETEVSEDDLARVLYEAEYDREAYPWENRTSAEQLTYKTQAEAALRKFRIRALAITRPNHQTTHHQQEK